MYDISPPHRMLLHRLAEVGHLYKRVATFVASVTTRANAGMIEQSLARHLNKQLTEYYRIVAVLESHVSASQPDQVIPDDTLITLRQLDVWIDDWRLRLRMMSVCVEACNGTIQEIHSLVRISQKFI